MDQLHPSCNHLQELNERAIKLQGPAHAGKIYHHVSGQYIVLQLAVKFSIFLIWLTVILPLDSLTLPIPNDISKWLRFITEQFSIVDKNTAKYLYYNSLIIFNLWLHSYVWL